MSAVPGADRGAPKLAFGSWAFSFGPFADAPWSFERLCRYAAEAGYDGVEINGFRPHPHHADYDSDATCAELRALIADAGLQPAGYAPDFTTVPPSEVAEESYLAEIDAARRFCERMGIGILRVDTVSPPDALAADEYERRFARLVKTWGSAAERCRRSGITLVWEFEPGFWLNRPSEVLRLAEAVADPGFKLLFDTSHAYMGAVAGARQVGEPETLDGGVAEYARLVNPHVGHVHLIDSDGSLHDDETSAHIPFGRGGVDFPAALDALRPALDGLEWWGIDFCFCPTTEVDARAAVPFVRNLAADHADAAR
jgi:sugar phosphate isomerase/epimerase